MDCPYYEQLNTFGTRACNADFDSIPATRA